MIKQRISLLILATLVLLGLSQAPRFVANAAPAAVATEESLSTIWTTQAITQDTRSNAIDLGEFSRSDVEVTVVQGSSINTATVRMDKSVGGYDWATGTTLLNASAISTTVVATHTSVGRYGSIYVDVSNSNPITLTVRSWNRP